MKNIEILNQYLADLFVLTAKLHNLHWNVVGKNFINIHSFTDDMYNYVFEFQDDVAELLKMKNEFPIVKLSDALKLTKIEELDSKDFSDNEVLNILLKDIEYMINSAKNIRNIFGEDDDFAVTNLLEEQISKFTKDLWIIKSSLK